MLAMAMSHLGFSSEIRISFSTEFPKVQYPIIATGKWHKATTIKATMTPLHIGPFDGLSGVEGIVD